MNGMHGLNGAARPHLYTEETRLVTAIEKARTTFPHAQRAFCSILMADAGLSLADASVYWRLWRAEQNALPMEHVTMWTDEAGRAKHSTG